MDDKPSILLVDDEPTVGKRLKPALEKNGYEVEVFEEGGQALQRLSERSFDIVVTDMRMDEVDGLQVLQAAKDRLPRAKVIIITGYATMEMARESLAKGAFEVIAKPFSPKDLREAIARAVKALRESGA